jgi:hypothetical protein
MQPSSLKLFYEPKDRLRMTVGDEKSYVSVKPAWSAPLSHPNQYLALLDGTGQEIVTIKDLEQLPSDSLSAVKEELGRRYLTAEIWAIESARSEFGATYWTVETDRGRRDFVTQSLQENAQWLGEGHLLLVDVDGNRFEIPNVAHLDGRSRQLVDKIL